MDDQENRLISLAASLQPLQEYFNSNQGKERVLALVSPTCAECLFGAEAVHYSILEPFPTVEISTIIIWVPMLKTDNEEMARLAAATISDPRATHFYDGSNRAGKAIARLFVRQTSWPGIFICSLAKPAPGKNYHQSRRSGFTS